MTHPKFRESVGRLGAGLLARLDEIAPQFS